MALKPKVKLFVRHLCADPEQNATKAYIAAGYSAKGAYSSASRLLRNAEVQAEIAKVQNKAFTKVEAKLELNTDWVLERLVKMASYDPRKFLNKDGTAKHIHELGDDEAMAVAGFEIVEVHASKTKKKGATKKFKMVDRGQALERLGRYLKMFTDKVEGEIKISKVIVPIDEPRATPPQPTAPDFG